MRSNRWLVTILVAAALLLTACQAPRLPSSELPDDGPPIVVSDAAARSFVDKVTAAGETAAQNGELRLTVTQEEASSFLHVATDLSDAMRLTEAENLRDLDLDPLRQEESLPQWLRDMAADQELPDLRLPDFGFLLSIRQPTVYFDDGQIIVRGYGEVLGLRQPLRVVLAPRAANGELVLDFVDGTIGPLPMPEILIDEAGQQLANLLLASRDYVQITEVHAGDGMLTIVGRYTG